MINFKAKGQFQSVRLYFDTAKEQASKEAEQGLLQFERFSGYGQDKKCCICRRSSLICREVPDNSALDSGTSSWRIPPYVCKTRLVQDAVQSPPTSWPC